jgi:hypothetical protein
MTLIHAIAQLFKQRMQPFPVRFDGLDQHLWLVPVDCLRCTGQCLQLHPFDHQLDEIDPGEIA